MPSSVPKKWVMRACHHILLITAIFLGICFGSVRYARSATIERHNLPKGKSRTAISRASAKIDVDGDLSDPAWKLATWFDNFVQNQPTFGSKPSMKTSFAALYDSEKIYFAVRCEIDNPKNLITRLTRRDRDGDFDAVAITLSPRGNNQTGYTFKVNPNGVQRDMVWTSDTAYDDNWDAVWQTETRIEDDHWSLEVAIPLDQIRFPLGIKHWGLQVVRWISSRQENVSFSPISPNKNGQISQAGVLEGTGDIAPRMPLSIMPEAFAAYQNSSGDFDGRPQNGFNWGMGGYAKVGLAPDWTLDLAVNPDFGEVEVDQALLNLTAIETRFEEKRPFFLEGVGLFKTPLQLFYSRRLGKGAPDPDLADNEEISWGPRTTQILTAAKLTGRTANGISAGIIETFMMPSVFKVHNTDTGETTRRESTPWTNAGVLRLAGELSQGSTFGVMGTALNPSGKHRGSYTGGVDWNVNTNNKDYVFTGQVAGSYRLEDLNGREKGRGLALVTKIQKQGGGHIRGHIDYQLRSKDFDLNDLGYLGRANLHHVCSHLQYREIEKSGPFLAFFAGIYLRTEWNVDGLSINKWGETYFKAKWSNSWWTEIGLWGSLAHFDDLEMGTEGPALRRASTGGGWAEINTAGRKPLGARLKLSAGSEAYGYLWEIRPAFLVRLGQLELELAWKYKYTEGRMAYVDLLDEDGPNEQYVIGKRDVNEMNFSLKGTVIILRNLSLQLYSQLLLTRTNYYNFSSLAFDKTTRPVNYTASNPNFAAADFRTQALLMWEYLPGSNLYLVYTRYGQGNTDTGPRSLRRSAKSLNNEHEQIFMLKLSRRFG